jgi:hypothetical protein
MLTLCLIATVNTTMLLRDCDDPSKLYAAQRGYDTMLRVHPKEMMAMGVNPKKKTIAKMRLIGWNLPVKHEDLSK